MRTDVKSFRSKSGLEGCRNQSKSIKIVTSCAGHVDRMNKLIDNNSSITLQNQPEVFRQKADGLEQLLIQKV